MRRQESSRPTAGCLSVPLFNQKKRSRIPLTSAPSENQFFSHSEYQDNTRPPPSHSPPGTCERYQAPGGSSARAPPNLQWNRKVNPQPTPLQQYSSTRSAPGPAPALKNYTVIPHPYKPASSKTGQPNKPVRQPDPSPSVNPGQGKYPAPSLSQSAQRKPTTHTGFSQTGQQSSYRPPNPPHQCSQPSRPPAAPAPPLSRPPGNTPPGYTPPGQTAQPQNNKWKFSNTFGPQKDAFAGNRSTNRTEAGRQTQTQEVFPSKPVIENSLRILTAVIDGMRHWSQFKDKVPYLFEIFATLDSAVTLGRHGAKNFLMRDGREVVQCVFYENERELPRLIRGQVHRCVGNYDRSRDVLMCVSVRAGQPSELRNAQEAVKACDTEMRALVKSISEV